MVPPLDGQSILLLLSLSNDHGFTMITNTAILFGKTTLHMAQLVLVGVFALSKGIAGLLAFPYTQRKLGWSNLRIVTLLASWYRAYLRMGVSDPYRL